MPSEKCYFAGCTLIVIIFTLICLIILLSAASKAIFNKRFSELEKTDVRQNAERAFSALSDDLATLNTTAGDYAGWDETYAFIEENNDRYIVNFNDSTFVKLRLNLLLLIDNSARIVYGKGFDLKDNKEVPYAESLNKHLFPESVLLKHNDTDSSVAGIVLLEEGPMLIASRPIITSEYKGPARGTLVMGRFLDSNEISRLAETTKLSISLQNINDPRAPHDFQTSADFLSGQAPVFIQPLNTYSIAGYVLIKDIYEKPALFLKVDMPRAIYRQGQISILYFILAIVAVGLAFGAVTMLLLEKLILSRLANLSKSVNEIGTISNLSARLSIPGNDEVSRLAEKVNDMLDALEQSQCELKDSEERYRSLVENSPDLICLLNSKFEFVSVNQAGLIFLGYTKPEELMERSFFNYIDPDDRKTTFGLFREAKATRTNTIKGHKLRMVKNNGETVWAELHSRMIYDRDNFKSFCIVRDITVRIRTEEALNESEARYCAIVEDQTELICRFLLDGTLTFVNEAYCRFFGKTRWELIGTSFASSVLDEDIHKVFKFFSSLNKENPVGVIEYRVIAPNGTIYRQQWTGRAIFDQSGNFLEYQSVGRDVTDQKQTQEELRLSEERFFKIYNASPSIMAILSFVGDITDGRFIDVNDSFYNHTGYTREEVIGKTTSELNLFSDKSDLFKIIEKILKNEEIYNMEVVFRIKSGEERIGLESEC